MLRSAAVPAAARPEATAPVEAQRSPLAKAALQQQRAMHLGEILRGVKRPDPDENRRVGRGPPKVVQEERALNGQALRGARGQVGPQVVALERRQQNPAREVGADRGGLNAGANRR